MSNFTLPKLNYNYGDLAPQISEEQLKIHYEKHHQAYATGANGLLDQIAKARKDNTDFDAKAVLKALSFNIAGFILHSLFWENLLPVATGGGKISGNIEQAIIDEFGSFDRFKKEFTQASLSVEGSGWAVLTYSDTGRLLIAQIEKHNVNLYPGFAILLVLDVFEHAYYLDYKNDRAKFIEAFWQIVNWNEVNNRLAKVKI